MSELPTIEHDENAIVLTKYDLKPPACSSPHVRRIGGVYHRVHFGYRDWSGYIAPSKVLLEDDNEGR